MIQDEIEAMRRARAAAQRLQIEAALVKLTMKLAEQPEHPRASAWKLRCEAYRQVIAEIAEHGYAGWTGNPVGAITGVPSNLLGGR